MTNPPDIRESLDRLIRAKIETRLAEMVEERLNVLLGPSGEPKEAKVVTRVREPKPGKPEEFHDRILIRRIRVTEAHPRKRVEVLCKVCGEKQTLTTEAWKKGGCRCQAHTKISPETAARRAIPLMAYSDGVVASVKSKLLRVLKLGDEETMTATEWGKLLDIDQRHLGRAFGKLAKANNDFVLSKTGRNWRVERRA